MSNMVCSKCGASCWEDSRGGSVDHILTCNCEKQGGSWYADRGGPDVWVPDAHPIVRQEYQDKQLWDSSWDNERR